MDAIVPALEVPRKTPLPAGSPDRFDYYVIAGQVFEVDQVGLTPWNADDLPYLCIARDDTRHDGICGRTITLTGDTDVTSLDCGTLAHVVAPHAVGRWQSMRCPRHVDTAALDAGRPWLHLLADARVA